MRESRLSGSVEGVMSNHDPYSDSSRALVGWHHQSLLGRGSRHCYGIITPKNLSMSGNRPVFWSYLECGDLGVKYMRESESEIFASLPFTAWGSSYRPAVELPIRHCRHHSSRHFDRAKGLPAAPWRDSCSGGSRNYSGPKTSTTHISRTCSECRDEPQSESGPCQERTRGAA